MQRSEQMIECTPKLWHGALQQGRAGWESREEAHNSHDEPWIVDSHELLAALALPTLGVRE
eukprot:11315160-Alexandrium_andersonii.AAC.1